MKAMIMERIVDLHEEDEPLTFVDLPDPQPATGEVLVAVNACGVCHTELDELEGRTPPPRLPVVLGHEIIGRVVALGDNVRTHRIDDRIGVGWIHRSSGSIEENLSPQFVATGRDVNGGYAQLMTVPADYAFAIPEEFTDAQAAPLLCAGAIGHRALKLTGLEDGQRLGLTGFGGSAHLVAQLARRRFPNCEIYVFARDENARAHARSLGAVWTGETKERAPHLLDAIIDTTPAWAPVVAAMANLKPGGRLVINAIRKEDVDKQALLSLSYHEHLWMEREIKSVANITRLGIAEFLQAAAEFSIKPEVETFSLQQANRALVELKREPVRGAKVLLI